MIDFEIEEILSKKKKFWVIISISGIFLFLIFSFISFLYFWDLVDKEPVFGPVPDPIDVIQNNVGQIVVIPISGIIFILFGSFIGYEKQINKPISDLFQLYNISLVKQLTGRLYINDSSHLSVIWNIRKKKFVFMSDSEVVAYAKPSNLFWKTMYLIYKFSNEN
ncbi:MAG: hypothetical protein ACW981_07160 [Candidatus Hodarchaeales archaeon]|jgi:hypothetical protein